MLCADAGQILRELTPGRGQTSSRPPWGRKTVAGSRTHCRSTVLPLHPQAYRAHRPPPADVDVICVSVYPPGVYSRPSGASGCSNALPAQHPARPLRHRNARTGARTLRGRGAGHATGQSADGRTHHRHAGPARRPSRRPDQPLSARAGPVDGQQRAVAGGGPGRGGRPRRLAWRPGAGHLAPAGPSPQRRVGTV